MTYSAQDGPAEFSADDKFYVYPYPRFQDPEGCACIMCVVISKRYQHAVSIGVTFCADYHWT